MTISNSDLILNLVREGNLDELKRHEDNICNVRNALHYACGNNHVAIVEYLLEHKIDPNCTNSDKNTPLHWCAMTNALESATLMIQYGADPRLLNRSGKSPITIAFQANYNDLLELLVDASLELEQDIEE